MSEDVIKTKFTEVSTNRSRMLAVSGIILSSTIMACASGLLFAYIPLTLLAKGFEPWVPAAMVPAMAFGGIFGCYAAGPLLRLSGHARVFMLLYALIIISAVIIGFFDSPWAWLVSRVIYGFGVNTMFVVAQSWLHFASTDSIRGKVITGFYVSYILSLGVGSYLIGFLDISDNSVPLLATVFVALAILPVALTRLPQPDPPESLSVDIRKVWKISPVGIAGMMAVGGLTVTLQSFVPIYVNELGYSKSDVGMTMVLMQIGLIIVQVPMGALSDRIDRRLVLIMVALCASIASLAGFTSNGALGLIGIIAIFALWNGFNETIYSVSSAIANDRADPQDYVMLSSTQMIAWSITGFLVPLFSTFAATIFPITFFMPLCGTITLIYGIFVIYRMKIRDEVPDEEKESFQPVTAVVAYPGDYSNPDAWEDEDAGSSEGLVS